MASESSAKGRRLLMLLPVSVFVRLSDSVCPLDYSKSYERILVKLFGEVGVAPRTK